MDQKNNKISTEQLEGAVVLEKQLMELRHELKPNEQNQQKDPQSLSFILSELSSIHEKVHTFLLDLSKQQAINEVLPQKLSLYYFQVLNLLLINLGPSHNFEVLHPILISNNFSIFAKLQERNPNRESKSFKAFLIFYFNLVKRINPSFVSQEQMDTIFRILSDILSCYFSSHSQKGLQKEVKFKQETQWIGFIFQVLPKIECKQIGSGLCQSFLRGYFDFLDIKQTEHKERRKCKYLMLHMLGNFLHLLIESRTTTQIVKGFECPIQDVREMYSKPNKDMLCNIQLKSQDVQFICQLFIESYLKEKALFKEIFINKTESIETANKLPQNYALNSQENQVEQFSQNAAQNHMKDSEITLGQTLIEIINILNSVLFLGGYSPKLQTLVYQKLFQNNILPEFLELAYLIYNQRRFMGKHSIKVTMSKPPDANLSKALQIDYESITKDERYAIFKLIGRQIKYGQLSVLLRLMTNLIHINNEALTYFENNIKYVHMIMSLTHDSEMNLTMKNWAVLFIKNSCDSQFLRDQIAKIKIQMKVEE